MASINKVILIGNCGRDPEVRYLASGRSVSSISLATTNRRKDIHTGNFIDETQWHRVSFFERQAEIVQQHVKKGSLIYVEGRLKYGKYTDQSGVERHTVEIIAYDMQLLSGRESSGPSTGSMRQKPETGAGAQVPPVHLPPATLQELDDEPPF